jgi:capsular polysaccharide biosynthesis protein
VPSSVDQQKSLILLGLGGILGLLAGIALAFMRDRLDPSVKTPAEVRDVTGLPVVAEVHV